MKKVLRVLWMLAVFFSVEAIADTEVVDGVAWNYYVADGKVTISRTILSGDVVMPDTIKGLPVADIAGYAFSGCSNLTSVAICDGLTHISDGAFFNCAGLKTVSIPESVMSIDLAAFSGCGALTDVKIPSGVTNIARSAFARCGSLTSVTIPSGVKTIEEAAFYTCEGLLDVSMSDSVMSLGNVVFFCCTNLTNVVMSSCMTNIGSTTFYGCSNLVHVTIPDRVLSVGEDAFARCPKLETISIPYALTQSMSDYERILKSGNSAEVIVRKKSADAIDFDDTYADELNGVWRTIAAGTTTAMPAVPCLSIPGGASGSYRYYVWTKDSSVAEVEGGLEYRFADGVTRKVAVVTVNMGDVSVPFSIRAKNGVIGMSTEVHLSDTPTNIYNRAGDLITNFTTRVIKVIEPPPPSISIVLDNTVVTTSTNNYLSVATLDVELSEPWDQDVVVLLTPEMKSGSGVNPFAYIGMSTKPSANPIEGEPYRDRVTNLVIRAGCTRASECDGRLYVYANRANDDTAKGIRFTPSIDPASANMATAEGFFVEKISATLQINASKPVITYPVQGREYFFVPANTPLDFTITVADAIGQLEDKYTVYIDYNGSGVYEAIPNLTANVGGEITFQYRYIIGGRTYNSSLYVENQDGHSNRETPLSYVVHVNAAKKVEVATDNEKKTYCEGQDAQLTFKFTEPFVYEADAYVFLVPVDENSRNLVECDAFTYGIPISVGSTEPSRSAHLVLKDGWKGCAFKYNVVVRSTNDPTDDTNIISVWGSDGITLYATNAVPSVLSVSMNRTPAYLNGETLTAKAAVGVQNMFEVSAWDESVDVDLEDAGFETIVKFWENGAVAHTETLNGNPYGQQIPYIFTTEGKNKVTVHVYDKDMTAAERLAVDKNPFTVFVETASAPAISLTPSNSSMSFTESDMGATYGLVYVDLTMPPTGLVGTNSITVKLEVERVDTSTTNNYALPVLNTTELQFRNGVSRKSFHFTSLDGTSLSTTKGFRIRACVTTGSPSPDVTKTWAQYYAPCEDFVVFVANEAPVIGPGFASTDTIPVASGVPYPIAWSVADVVADLERLQVTWTYNGSSVTTTENMVGKTGEKSVVFTGSGSQTVDLTVTDKDGASDTRTYYFNVSAPPTQPSSGECVVDGITWYYQVLNDEEVKLTYSDFLGEVMTIPSELDGYRVTHIAEGALMSFGMTRVTIPESVTYVGPCAFACCDNLVEVVFKGNRLTIDEGSYVFDECYALETILVSCALILNFEEYEAILTEGNNASVQARLAESEINGVTWYYDVWVDDQGESGVYIVKVDRPTPEHVVVPVKLDGCNVTGIGSNAFGECLSLTGITIPDSVTVVGVCAFGRCENLKEVIVPDRVRSIESYAFGECHSLTSVVIGCGVTNIGDAVFFQCDKLVDITIPDSVMNVGSNVFAQCTNLQTISIPKHLAEYRDRLAEGNGATIIVRDDREVSGVILDGDGATFNEGESVRMVVLLTQPNDSDLYAFLEPLDWAAGHLVEVDSSGVKIPAGTTNSISFINLKMLDGSIDPSSLRYDIILRDGALATNNVVTTYRSQPIRLSVRNVAPVNAYVASTNAVRLALGKTANIAWDFRDVAADLATNFSVRITYDGREVYGDGPTDSMLVRFDTAGMKTVYVTGTDKDGGSSSFALYFEVAKKDAISDDGTEPGIGGVEVPAGGISKYDVTVMYDGRGHSINDDLLEQVELEYGTPQFSYAFTTNGPWSAHAPVFTNVCEKYIWYRISSANYANDYLHVARLSITNRPVTLTSGSGSWVYDGYWHAATNVQVNGAGFVPGDEPEYGPFAEIRDVGTVDNTFSYSFENETVARNYLVTVTNGVLEVTPNLSPDLGVLDLIIGVTNNVLAPNSSLTLTYVVTNAGDAVAKAPWKEQVWLQDGVCPTNDLLLTTYKITDSLAIGADITRTSTILIPETIRLSDSFRFKVVVDADGDVDERKNVFSNMLVTDAYSLRQRLQLTLPTKTVAENTSSPILRCTLGRQGSLQSALTVRLSSSSGDITVPNEVEIPAGTARIVFNATVHDNDKLDGSRDVVVTAATDGHEGAVATIIVTDNEVPTVSVSLESVEITEGQIVAGTVSRDFVTDSPITVYLSGIPTSQCTYPSSVVIPAGEATVAFELAAIDNDVAEIGNSYTLRANAAGHTTTTLDVQVLDDDVPGVVLELTPEEVSESAGAYAAYATLTRVDENKIENAIRVKLAPSEKNQLILPSSITIPARTMSVRFAVGTIDNALDDGDREVVIDGAIVIESCGCNGQPSSGDAIQAAVRINDDDGPALKLTANPSTMKEGVENAGTLILSHNTTLTEDLVVALSHDKESEIEIAATVTIPAGETSVEIPVTTLDDGVEDGAQTVSVYADAEGFSSGSTWILVSDQNLPDFTLANVLPEYQAVIAGETLKLTFDLKNIGFKDYASGVPYAVHLVAGANSATMTDDTLVLAGKTTAGLAMNGMETITVEVTAPTTPGDYRFAVVADPDGIIAELDNVNNTGWSLPVTVNPSYAATATVAGETFMKGDAVAITGSAVMSDGTTPAANVAVEVYVIVNGIRRTIAATTDAAGNFEATFNPLANEAGHFTVGACYPGVGSTTEQDAFDILGMERTSTSHVIWDVTIGDVATRTIDIRNLTPIPLTGLKVETVDCPDECSLVCNLAETLGGNGYATLEMTATATGISEGTDYKKFYVRITSAEGVTLEIPLYFYSQSQKAFLKANPATIKTTMAIGTTRYVDFTIMNAGQGDSGKITVSAPSADWLRIVGGTTIENLKNNESAIVTVELAPTDALELGNPLTGRFAVNCANGTGLVLPFTFTPVSNEKGKISVDVTDEYTYYLADAPHVSGATVRVTNPYTGEVVATGTTGEDGKWESEELPEGKYNVSVSATKHGNYIETVTVNPDETTSMNVFLQFQAITAEWKVERTEVEDQYDITLELEYEVNVPAPVLKISFDGKIPELQKGESFGMSMVIQNIGLIAAHDVQTYFPQIRDYVITIPEMGFAMAAGEVKTIPILIECPMMQKSKNGASSSSLDCHPVTTTRAYYYCGDDRQYHEYKKEISVEWECEPQYIGPDPIPGPVLPNPEDPDLPLWEGPRIDLPDIGSGWGSFFTSTGCEPCYKNVFEAFANGCLLSALDKLINVKGWKDIVKQGSLAFIDGYNLGSEYAKPDISTASKIATSVIFALGKKYPAVAGVMSVYDCIAAFFNICPKEALEQQNQLLSLMNTAESLSAFAREYNTGSDRLNTLLSNLDVVRQDIEAVGHLMENFFGDNVWLECNEDEFVVFMNNIEETLNANKYLSSDVLVAHKPSNISDEQLSQLVEYWNNSIKFYNYETVAENAKVFSLSSFESYLDVASKADAYYANGGYADIVDCLATTVEELEDFLEEESDSVCASVSLKLSQTATMTREAFDGTLTLFNGHASIPMTDIKLELSVTDSEGNVCNDLFGITPNGLDVMTGSSILDGDVELASGKTGTAKVLFVPSRDAAPEVAKTYYFGGTLSYTDPFTGETAMMKLTAVPLAVNPSPYLKLDYFVQRDVYGDDPFTADKIEPSLPAEVSVLIQNKGYGDAKNVIIDSVQPEIFKNDKGLQIDFKLMDYSTSLNGSLAHLGLKNVSLGTIAAQENAVAQWWLTSSLQGHFIGMSAKVSQRNSWGNQDANMSLIDEDVGVHELIRSIVVNGEPKPAFLVSENDVRDLPDMIYTSSGDVIDVHNEAVATCGAISGGTMTLSINTSASGWNYASVVNETLGNYEIKKVVRSDGTEVPLRNVWLTDRTFRDSLDTLYENRIHIVDDLDSVGMQTYMLTLEVVNTDGPQVVAFEGVTADSVLENALACIDVVFDRAIDASTFTIEDLTLYHQGTRVEDLNGLTIAQIDEEGLKFRIGNLASINAADGMYELIVQAAGIANTDGTFGLSGKSVTWVVAGAASDTIPPAQITDLRITPDRGVSDSDGITCETALTVVGTLPEEGLSVSVYSRYLGGSDTLLASVKPEGTSLSAPVKLTSGGNVTLVVVCTDAAGNSSESTVGVFVDMIDLTATISGTPELNQTVKDGLTVSFSDDVNDDDLRAEICSLTLNGEAVSVPGMAFEKVDAKTWLVMGLEAATSQEGTYVFAIDLASVHKTLTGKSGTGRVQVEWKHVPPDTTSPTIAGLQVDGGEVKDEYLDGFSTLQVAFSEEVNIPELIANEWITQAVRLMICNTDGVVTGVFESVASDYAWNASDNTLTWTLAKPLVHFGDVKVVLDGALIKDKAGNPLSTDGFETTDCGLTRFGDATDLVQTTAQAMPTWHDFNGDGLGDLIVGEKASGTEGRVRIYLNAGTAETPLFDAYTYLQANGGDLVVTASGCQGASVCFLDLTGDGIDDLLVGQSDGVVSLHPATAKGVFGVGEEIWPLANTTMASERAVLTVADIDADGQNDLLLGGLDGKIRVLSYDSTTKEVSAEWLTTYKGTSLSVSAGRSSPTFADLSGDATPELVSGDTDGNIWLFAQNGGAFISSPVKLFDNSVNAVTALTRSRTCLADVNGDGVADLLVGTADGTVKLMTGAKPSNACMALRVTRVFDMFTDGAAPVVGDVTVMYDGTAHTIDTTQLEGVTLEHGTPTIVYATSENGPWSATVSTFTDACETSVWYKISAPYYNDYVREVKVTITKRPVTLMSASGSWKYDAQTHANETIAVGGEGFVKGDEPVFSQFAAITDIGTKNNTFVYTFAADRIASNYLVTVETGVLEIVAPSLSEALDTDDVVPEFVWTTGGDTSWFVQTATTTDGIDAVQSGAIGNSAESWIETTVEGRGTLSFKWRVSCEDRYDSLQLLVDGVVMARLTGEQGWQTHEIMLTEDGLHTLRWRYAKGRGGVAGDDCAWLDHVFWKPRMTTELTLSDALDADNVCWKTSGDAVWTAQDDTTYDSFDAARSGMISDYGSSRLETVVHGPGKLTFTWKVSCEEGYDWFDFLLDGNLEYSISGETDWETVTVVIPEGRHILTWEYWKDEYDEEGMTGEDCVWLDCVKVESVAMNEFTATTPEPVPHAWLESFGLLAAANYNPETAANADADGDGFTAWQEYVIGSKPNDKTSAFTSSIEIVDGKPVVSWKPDLNEDGTKRRDYTVSRLEWDATQGKFVEVEELSGVSGAVVTPKTRSDYKGPYLFRVKVALP